MKCWHIVWRGEKGTQSYHTEVKVHVDAKA